MTGDTATDLGRALFKRGGNPGWGAFSLLGGLLFGGLLVWAGAALPGSDGLVVVLLGLGMGGLFVGLGLRYLRYRAAVHERGIMVFNGFVQRQMRFDQARTFSYGHLKGYGQHNISLGLVPFEGSPVTVDVNPRWGLRCDEHMESLRATLTPRFADKMESELKRRGSVEWVALRGSGALPTTFVSITPDGYVIRTKTGESRFLYAQLALTIGDGVLKMTERGSGKRVCSFECAIANFYPGLALVKKLAVPALAQSPISPG